jgi:hypothetical protein
LPLFFKTRDEDIRCNKYCGTGLISFHENQRGQGT